MAFGLKLPWTQASSAKAPAAKSWLPGAIAALAGDAVAQWSGRSYTAIAREGFMRNPVAHRATRMIAEAAASVPWLVFDGGREQERHPVLDLLGRPDPNGAGDGFFETLYGHLVLSGNAWINPVSAGGHLAGLQLLRPDRMRVITGPDGWPTGYEHQAGGRRQRFAVTPEEGPGLLHLKLFHPLDDHLGFAPLEAALMALDLHNAAMNWNKALLDNSARPSGALVYQPKDGGNLTPEQYERLKAELEEGYQGARRAGRPMLLEGGLDWKAMGLTPRDMDFVEAKNGAARDIALALGVPPMLLGIPGDLTYANYQEANRAFCRLTVLPLVARTAQALTAWLQPIHGAGLKIDYDADRLPGLSAERDGLWARVGAADFLTDEEKREAVGYQRVAG
ncbi:phage portal protein [Hoeflea ulvae]|uniref:Phage portal protein n=1 Tax=Hoeflea ulvae TaxID=2983764 RepID=A0ABT3YEW6_9HYPH|nr:phage portal protein [Hoeflea ulvae]MCY0094436.1 phage portal protein [Hoeflea ulvae]